MIYRIFKSNQPLILVFLLLPVFLIIYFFLKPLSLNNFPESSLMPFYQFALKIVGNSKAAIILLTTLLITGQAILLNFIVHSFSLQKKRTTLPGLFYALLMLFLPGFVTLSPLLFANLFIMLSINRLFHLGEHQNALSIVFDSSFFISIATLFYFPSLMFIIMVWVGIIISKSFSWRDWVISLTGFLIPFIFIITYDFWHDQLNILWYEITFRKINMTSFFTWGNHFSFYLLFIFFVYLSIISFFPFISDINANKLKTQKALIMIAWIATIAGATFFLIHENAVYHFSVLAIPFSIYISNYFVHEKRTWLSELYISLLVGLIIYNHIMHI
jgi:hypothetical protein